MDVSWRHEGLESYLRSPINIRREVQQRWNWASLAECSNFWIEFFIGTCDSSDALSEDVCALWMDLFEARMVLVEDQSLNRPPDDQWRELTVRLALLSTEERKLMTFNLIVCYVHRYHNGYITDVALVLCIWLHVLVWFLGNLNYK